MNRFVEHHRESIRFGYSCFDRIRLNAVIRPLQPPAIIVGYLDRDRQVPAITKAYFRQVSESYHRWVEELASTRGVPIVEPPRARAASSGSSRTIRRSGRRTGWR